MRRFRKRMYEEYSQEFTSDESFNAAYKKVRRIKRFYSHLKVYIIVNVIIIVSNLSRGFSGREIIHNGLWDWDTYSTAIFWGIGLAIHALSVFGSDLFFNDEWEQRKIQEYMKKEQGNTNKWQ
jgi:hypothetical protein